MWQKLGNITDVARMGKCNWYGKNWGNVTDIARIG